MVMYSFSRKVDSPGQREREKNGDNQKVKECLQGGGWLIRRDQLTPGLSSMGNLKKNTRLLDFNDAKFNQSKPGN